MIFKPPLIILILLLSSCHQQRQLPGAFSPPVAKKIPHTITSNGNVRVDNYYWLRDDSRSSSAVLDHLEAENLYLKKVMRHTESLQNIIYKEISERINNNQSTVPYLFNGYWYKQAYLLNKEYKVHFRKINQPNSTYKIFIDENQLAKNHSFFELQDYSISTNNKILAYSYDTLARRIYSTNFINLDTGKKYNDVLVGVEENVVWANDNLTVFYIKKDLQTLLGSKVYRHKLGTPQSEDVLVYEEKDLSYFSLLSKSNDLSTIFLSHDSIDSADTLYLDANTPDASFKFISKRDPDIYYTTSKFKDIFYILTNENAKNYKLMSASKSQLEDKSKWKEVVPGDDNIYLESFTPFNEFLVVKERALGKVQMRIILKSDNSSQLVPFSDPVFVVNASNNFDPESPNIRVKYSSLTTPETVYDINLKSLSKIRLKQKKILGDFRSHKYKSEFIYVNSRDGKQIPVSIVYRKNLFKMDGTNPLYQYAYGSYGVTVEPGFRSDLLSLLDRGFIFVIAHVRGSSALGDDWYKDGKLLNKKNTFYDFIDVTKALIKMKYVDGDKVFASGASAGGLLMGAISNMAPELYLGISAMVPWVDVVTSMLDPSIPLTTNEYDEWGNPAESDSKAYDYMLSYSPYDGVERQHYPNMLVSAGLYDPQVQYFEPAKWVAKLREYKTGDSKLIFTTDSSGHSGASGRFNQYKLTALEYAFFLDLIETDK